MSLITLIETNMKTEREKLEQNTREAYAQQKADEFIEFITAMIDESIEMHRWQQRASKMTIFTVFIWFAFIPFGEFIQTPADVFDVAHEWLFTIFIMMVFRSHWHDLRWKYADGKVDGALAVLEKLGYSKNDDELKKKKKKRVKYKSPFKRFKEFWERMGSKENQEAFA